MLVKVQITYQRGRKERAIISYLGKELRMKISIVVLRRILKEGKFAIKHCRLRNSWGKKKPKQNRDEYVHDAFGYWQVG